jgi:ribonuclease PH
VENGEKDAGGRLDGRGPSELRPLRFERGCVETPYGSCLVSMGRTRVLCTASVVEDVPPFLKGRNSGWVTAEYSMLPGSTPSRTNRERNRGGPGGRTQEIQRLIGRSMRAVVDLERLGPRTIWLDCDAIQSDGGTRTAAINGASVALFDALRRLEAEGAIRSVPMAELVGAVSVGIISDFPLLDLCYEEDTRADVDMNIVMTESGRFVEVQGTAEGEPFSRDDLETFLDLGERGIKEIIRAQRECLDAG